MLDKRLIGIVAVALIAITAAMLLRVPRGGSGGTQSGATATTLAAQNAVAMPEDMATERDFAMRGFIGTTDAPAIRSADGKILWDFTVLDKLFGTAPEQAPPTVNPSLYAHSLLNAKHGLFEVMPGIYQVRGFDISTVSFIEGDTGVIVVDPLTASENAAAAFALYKKHRGDKPVMAVIYTHSHGDHFGGILGVVSDQELKQRTIPILAPKGFSEHAISENVSAGLAMRRRAEYMFGMLLDYGWNAHIDSGLGKRLGAGSTALVLPTHEVAATGETQQIDGVTIEFQLTPGAEAPAEMDFYLPQKRALCMAEVTTAQLHNVATPRGAQLRDAKAWSHYIDEALVLYGARSDVLFQSHNWPRFGADYIRNYLADQRDLYKFIHDQTLRLANRGYTIDEIPDMIALPQTLARHAYARGYYGTLKHNARAVYARYLTWFDGNPANLDRLPPQQSATRYVEYMGGADSVIQKAEKAYGDGDYRWVAEVITQVTRADPHNAKARDLLARSFEQLGYQAESGVWRDFYLSGAKELREGMAEPQVNGAAEAQILARLPVGDLFEALALNIDPEKAEGKRIELDWCFSDVPDCQRIEIRNSVLNTWARRAGDPPADATVKLEKATLVGIMAGTIGVPKALLDGRLQLDGSKTAVLSFFGLLQPPNPNFPIVAR